MEALAALGIAGNVVQFLDFASKLCSTSREIYSTANGATAANAQTETLLKDFIESVDEVSSDLLQYRSVLMVSSKQALGAGQGQIGSVISNCHTLADELLHRFATLKSTGKPGRWRSFMTGVKCMWKKKELDELQDRLDRYKAELEWRILLSLRESVNLLASRQEDQFQVLQTSVITKLTEAIRDQISALPRWPQQGEGAQQKLRSETIATRASRYKQPEKSAIRNADSTGPPELGQEHNFFVDSYAQEFADKLAKFEENQWDSLSFSVMHDREDQIAKAELRTFEWILEKGGSTDAPWSNFLEWIENGKGLYWINGKAGSGKSTLMRYLNHHDKINAALLAWAGDTPLITASFFFYYNGSDLQKTQVGLLRALLYQAVENRRELIPIVLSDVLDFAANAPFAIDWTLPKLMRAFAKLIEQRTVPLKICIFVDGLDEYAGDHPDLIKLIRYASDFDHIKLCVSSRPLLVFDRAFGARAGLVLQDLTFGDIKTYVQTKLSADERFRELEIEEPALGPKLAFEVVSKSSGVFLWVKLVVHSLLEGLLNYDRGVDLERRLSELPEDLDGLYWHVLERVKPVWYLEEAFKLMLLVYAAAVPLNLLQLAFTEVERPNVALGSKVDEISLEKQQSLCKSMGGRIKSRCLGLLEVTDTAYRDEKYRRVQFLHKSVRDFIDTPRMKSWIKEVLDAKNTFVPELAIMKSLLLQLETIRPRLSELQSRPDGGLSREAWFDEVRPIVFEIVRYGHVADSRYPGISHTYGPFITQVDRIASDLWNSVPFRAPKEIIGEVHWSVAPRKPGGAGMEAVNSPLPTPPIAAIANLGEFENRISSRLVVTLDNHTSPTREVYDKIVFPGPSQTYPDSKDGKYLRGELRVRFADLPVPKCFPGKDNDVERPQSLWPLVNPWDSPYSQFILPTIDFAAASCGFEAFVRALNLNQYADERFGDGVKLGGIPEHDQAKIQATATEIAPAPAPAPAPTVLGKRSMWSRLKLIKK